MPGRGVYFALDDADERRLLAMPEARDRTAFVAREIEERWDADWLYAADDLWFPLHFCLHGSSAFPEAGSPAEAKAVFGGGVLGIPGVFSIDYKDRELVRRIASALARMRDDAVWARAGLVERKDYSGPKEHGLQVSVVDEVSRVREFYRKASDAGRAVIFTVDL